MAKSRKRRSPYVFIMWLDPDVKFVSINSLFKTQTIKAFASIPSLASFLKLTDAFLIITRTVVNNLTFEMIMHAHCADDNSGHMLTSLKILSASSDGDAVLLLLPLLVILGHVQQVDVSTNQPETAMTLLM